MQQVGTVREIWRYPVKSMQGDTLAACEVTARGVAGDRAWALRDETRQEVSWGKRFPQLMQCRARYLEEPDGAAVQRVEITFPDGEVLASDDAGMAAKLSALVGCRASLWPLQPAENRAFYRRYKPDEVQFMAEAAGWFAREPGEPLPDFATFPPELMDYVAVPGTFFDNEEIHLITTASMRFMVHKNPDASWDIRRFRPNFLIETAAGLDGLVENNWCGKHLRIGEVVLEITMPTPRCGMTVQPQADLAFDKTILRTIVLEGDQCLGVGGHCRKAGIARADDAVVLDG